MPTTDRSGGLIRRTLRRRRIPLLIGWMLLSGALVYAATGYVRGPYRATSFLRVDPVAQDLYGVRGAEDKLYPFLQTQVQLITSPNVLTVAGTNPTAATLPRIRKSRDVVVELRKVIDARTIPDTYLIEVACESESPGEAATLVNAVVEAYIEANVEWSDGMARTQIGNLESHMADLALKVEEVERRWKELVDRGEVEGAVFLKGQPARTGITLEQYKKIRDELFGVNLELAQLDAWVAALRNAAANVGKDPASTSDEAILRAQIWRRFQTDPEVIRHVSAMEDARQRLDQVRMTSAAEEDPSVRLASQKLASLKAEYDRMFEVKQKEIRAQVQEAGGFDPERELRETEGKALALRVRQSAMRGEFDKLEVRNLPRASDAVDIALVRDQRESLRSMQDAVNRRLEQLKFEAKGEARVRPVNAAVPPADRQGLWYRPYILGAIPFLALFGVVGLFATVQAVSEARVVAIDAGPEPDEPPAS